MNDELTPDVKTLALVLVAVTTGFILFVPTASAQDASCTEVLENRTDQGTGSSAPGGLLADAIGDQRDEIGSALNDRWFDARLENATSSRERAEIVAEEVERIEANVSTLERCWGINRTERVADRSLAELDADEREVLQNHTRTLHRRLNETQAEVDRLPVSVRDAHDVDAETLASLERRLVAVRNATAPQEASSATDGPFPFR